MRKIMLCMLLVVLSVLSVMLLTSCECRHEWSEANCVSPMLCTKCGETAGEAWGHMFSQATCTEAAVCSRCGMVDGQANGHQWEKATCMQPQTCSVCNATEGSYARHVEGGWQDGEINFKEAVRERIKPCLTCGEVLQKENVPVDKFYEGEYFAFTANEYRERLIYVYASTPYLPAYTVEKSDDSGFVVMLEDNLCITGSMNKNMTELVEDADKDPVYSVFFMVDNTRDFEADMVSLFGMVPSVDPAMNMDESATLLDDLMNGVRKDKSFVIVKNGIHYEAMYKDGKYCINVSVDK